MKNNMEFKDKKGKRVRMTPLTPAQIRARKEQASRKKLNTKRGQFVTDKELKTGKIEKQPEEKKVTSKKDRDYRRRFNEDNKEKIQHIENVNEKNTKEAKARGAGGQDNAIGRGGKVLSTPRISGGRSVASGSGSSRTTNTVTRPEGSSSNVQNTLNRRSSGGNQLKPKERKVKDYDAPINEIKRSLDGVMTDLDSLLAIVKAEQKAEIQKEIFKSLDESMDSLRKNFNQ